MMDVRVLIEGIGGVGGVLAARLAQAGYAPMLVTHNPDITTAIRAHGLRIIESGVAAIVSILVRRIVGSVGLCRIPRRTRDYLDRLQNFSHTCRTVRAGGQVTRFERSRRKLPRASSTFSTVPHRA